MEKSKDICLGKRKIIRLNYTRTVSLPKVLLQNMDVDTGDYLEFVVDSDGRVVIKPHKAQKINADEKVQ